MKLRLLSIVIIPVLFFLIAYATLDDYGISWDEPIHFYRGQAYLNYILSGKTKFDTQKMGSYYQNNQLSAEYWLEKDDGHPPLNGILASLFNFVFYQKLGILGDIESYHLFNIITSSILVLIVVLFAWETYGIFAAAVAGIVLASYPLFFAESHFNIKDPPQTAFFALTIWAFWKSLDQGWKWLLLSALSAGFALGTKFNILFLPFIIFPYLIARYNDYFRKGTLQLFSSLTQIPKSYILASIISPFVVFGIFFGTWPFLWQDPLENIPFVVRWYHDIGTGPATYGYFTFGGFNFFAPFWIFSTTPPWVLILTTIGIVAAVRRGKEHEWAPLLWLLWFFIPILRVVVPNTTVYGGVRQIMEFLPALSLLSGLGAYVVWEHFSFNKSSNFKIGIATLILLAFLPHIFIMAKLHPNQNVYFNSLIGGLPGAAQKNVPYWGNSFGNAYWQAVQWLNKNASQDAKMALIQGTTLNIPRIKLREDLRFSNSFWSGIYRDGEYLIELTHNDKRSYPYAWEYVEKFLEPVYEIKVDGVAIAKVWKNDLENTKDELKKGEAVLNNPLVKYEKAGEIILDMGRTNLLTRLVIIYTKGLESGHPVEDCKNSPVKVSTSTSGDDWLYGEEIIPVEQLTYREKENLPFQPFFFAARKARFLKLEALRNSSCVASDKVNFKIYMLEE